MSLLYGDNSDKEKSFEGRLEQYVGRLNRDYEGKEDANLEFRTFLKCHADEKELDEQFKKLHDELFYELWLPLLDYVNEKKICQRITSRLLLGGNGEFKEVL